MLIHEVTAEIEALHQFFTEWFRAKTDAIEAFDARLARSFVNIQPAGRVLTLAELRRSIVEGHGANPDFEITIEDVEIRWRRGDLVLATYVEVQRGARNTTPPTNRRVSTVLLQRTNSGWRWLHVHETKLP